MKKEVMKFKVVLEREEDGGYIVYCPVLKGCRSQGDTKEEALNNIKDAIKLYVETVEEINLKKKEITQVEVALR